ncbi:MULTISPECIES: TIGR02678 family protein [unclassified Cryobacterium]|uniref:TIGR02678 family protein n=1 Tax=unclassified Cryobacterium TaxID=2649013 RepID=UPI002AB46344|nr:MULTISPECIES: TIGR02678 family protein [unclassified Cryobacterium]MDY7541149.1 TIGR02678 family protein [Cryobacterium sp. 5B3]MEA9998899.1 TIGR02678 family protein [Cryobacterium sp. RTS3]MEB0265760.1 TIGR02678 family protein [Cryobacterium sp. 10I5]MEB0274280.1 TIGR02678 family protein [Cryobacterium sp. 5B3]
MSVSAVDDRQRAARMLLRTPLIRSTDEERYRLVRRHAGDLAEWFDINTGWALHVDSEVVRLDREPATVTDATHPFAARRGGVPFSRRRYVMLMLSLSVLERSDSQIALGRLAEQVLVAATVPELVAAGFVFELGSREERSDLVAAVQLLLEWGVLARVAGDEADFVQNTGDALYDVSRRVLSQLLVTRRGPSTIGATTLGARTTAMRDRGTAPTADLRNLRLRHSLTRRLLDDPVLYLDELDDDETAYLRGQRAAICRRITEFTGLVAEIRLEGIAMVDFDDDLSDVRMPEKGTEGHVTLLLAEFLARCGEPEVPVDVLVGQVRALAPNYAKFWRKGAADDAADLVETALGRLRALRLVARDGNSIRVLPALARYALTAPTIMGVRQS